MLSMITWHRGGSIKESDFNFNYFCYTTTLNSLRKLGLHTSRMLEVASASFHRQLKVEHKGWVGTIIELRGGLFKSLIPHPPLPHGLLASLPHHFPISPRCISCISRETPSGDLVFKSPAGESDMFPLWASLQCSYIRLIRRIFLLIYFLESFRWWTGTPGVL